VFNLRLARITLVLRPDISPCFKHINGPLCWSFESTTLCGNESEFGYLMYEVKPSSSHRSFDARARRETGELEY
jgi:hypothetical protein